MTGVFTINYPATMAVIDRMTKLVEKLTRINERYESKISTLSRCRGTTENPHNHDSQIASYRKIISNNSKDIVDLELLISQIISLMVNTKMTDFYLTQLIKNMMSDNSNVPNPETSVIDQDLTRQAAKVAGIGVTATGSPRIMSATDYKNYQAALTYLKSLESLKAQAREYEAKGQYGAANAMNQHIGSLSSKNTQEIKRHVGAFVNNNNIPAIDKDDGVYFKNGVAIFKNFNFDSVTINGSLLGSREGTLSEEEQLFLHDICASVNVDYYLALAIIVHESGCDANALDWKYQYHTGLMQLNPDHCDSYAAGWYYDSNINVKKIIDACENGGYQNEISVFKNESSLLAKQDALKNPYVNMCFGVAKLNQCFKDKNYHSWDSLAWYCGDAQSPAEDYYYRDTLAEMAGEQAKYREYYKVGE